LQHGDGAAPGGPLWMTNGRNQTVIDSTPVTQRILSRAHGRRPDRRYGGYHSSFSRVAAHRSGGHPTCPARENPRRQQQPAGQGGVAGPIFQTVDKAL